MKNHRETELTSINDAKLLGIRAPREIVDRAFLVQRNSAIKIASSTEQIHPSLSVVTLVRIVDFGLSKEENLSSKGVPFYLSTISFKECLLAGRRAAKSTQAKDLNARRGALIKNGKNVKNETRL